MAIILGIVSAILLIGFAIYTWLDNDEPLIFCVISIFIYIIGGIMLLSMPEKINVFSAESETQVIESTKVVTPTDKVVTTQVTENRKEDVATEEEKIEANSDAAENNEINDKRDVEKDDAINENDEIAEHILDVMLWTMVAVLLFSVLSASDLPDTIVDFIGSRRSKRLVVYEKYISNDNTEESNNDDGTDTKALPMRDFIVQIADLNAEIAECGLSRELNGIVKLLQAICKLTDSGLTHSSIRRMETYYLPELVNLLTYYKKREKQRDKLGEINSTLLSIENNARKIKQALKQVYSEMLETEAMPVNVASAVMDGELAKDFAQNEFKNENK